MTHPLPAIEAVGLGKAFGRTWAVRDVCLRVEQGERVALLGPNGAGKTTVLRLFSTLTKPTRGKLVIYGVRPQQNTQALRRWLGMVGHRPWLYEDLSATENLEFYGALYGVSDASSVYPPLLERAGLSDAAHTPIKAYSRGMQQRLALVRSLLHSPRILLLDEPETGLDQTGLTLLREIVVDPARTIVFTTHSFELALELADRIILMSCGRIVLDEARHQLDLTGLRSAYGTATVGAR